MNNTNTDKVYILKKDYESPSGKCYAGVSYTAKEWISRWFHKLAIEDFDIKTDWFVQKQPVEDKRIEMDKIQVCVTAIGDSDKELMVFTSRKLDMNKLTSVKQAIERELNGEHKCVYCGCWTAQDDSLCYKNPNNIPPTLERQDSKEDKGWEITEVECYGGEIRRLVNGGYRIFDDGIGFTWEELSQREDTKIKSVRRKSDGEVFTVGDKISWGCFGIYETTLTGFVIKDDDLKFYYDKLPKNGNPCSFLGAVGLHKLINTTQPKEEPKPLFVTEDGIGIYNVNTTVYKVHKTDFSLEFSNAAHIKNNKTYNDKFYFVFSTKAAAEEYILMNKPCLSVNEINELMLHRVGGWGERESVKKSAIQLANNKINK